MKNKPRILIVEEEPLYREFLSRTLINDYLIEFAKKSSEALELLNSKRFEVILFDPCLPGIWEQNFVQAIEKKLSQKTPLIGISSLEQDRWPSGRQENQFFSSFIKGNFSPKELRQTVQNSLLYQKEQLKKEKTKEQEKDLTRDVKREVTNKSGAEEKLETQYRTLFEQSLVGLYILKNEKIILSNDKLCEILGYAPHELDGHRLNNFLAPIALDESFPMQGDLLQLSSPLQEVQLKTRKGEIKTAFHCSAPIEGEKNHFVHGCIIDITGWMELGWQVLQHQKIESLGTLVSGIAHEFNNILAAMLPQAELIAQYADEVPAIRRSTQILLSMGEKATMLTRQLLNMSRKTTLKKSPVHVNTWLKDSINFLSSTLETSNQIQIDLDPHVNHIETDPNQLDLLLFNLFQNACDAMPEGGTLKISTILIPSSFPNKEGKGDKGQWVEITIQDRGCGISKENLSKIFDPFFTTKEAGQGTGLGLSVAYNLIKQLGGQIQVQSEVGHGSAFKILLPHISPLKKNLKSPNSSSENTPPDSKPISQFP